MGSGWTGDNNAIRGAGVVWVCAIGLVGCGCVTYKFSGPLRMLFFVVFLKNSDLTSFPVRYVCCFSKFSEKS